MKEKDNQVDLVQIKVKKVTDSVVICTLFTLHEPVEVMIKANDYETLLDLGFFKEEIESKEDIPGKKIISSRIYK
jgi:hypothetical protein